VFVLQLYLLTKVLSGCWWFILRWLGPSLRSLLHDKRAINSSCGQVTGTFKPSEDDVVLSVQFATFVSLPCFVDPSGGRSDSSVETSKLNSIWNRYKCLIRSKQNLHAIPIGGAGALARRTKVAVASSPPVPVGQEAAHHFWSLQSSGGSNQAIDIEENQTEQQLPYVLDFNHFLGPSQSDSPSSDSSSFAELLRSGQEGASSPRSMPVLFTTKPLRESASDPALSRLESLPSKCLPTVRRFSEWFVAAEINKHTLASFENNENLSREKLCNANSPWSTGTFS
jgi:hypothetical protein